MKPEDIFKFKSSRHHYIPKFLIEGFTNSDGHLYVYDKKRGSVLNKPQSAKSVFFENNRNTVEVIENKTSSAIEEILYGKIDNDSSKIIQEYQRTDISALDFSLEKVSRVKLFLITLFWRIPFTDGAAEQIFNASEIISEEIDPETLRNDPTFKKFERNRLFKNHIDKLHSDGKSGQQWTNIHQFSEDVLLLGDNPLLFFEAPKSFNEFDENGLLIAISSKRIFSSTPNKLERFPFANSKAYNVSIINQSQRYIVSPKKEILEESIEDYKTFLKEGLVDYTPKLAFEVSY